MGYNSFKDIGCHSIRKGATKWLSGQPGGPSAMSICIRGGWSLGGVKDVYMTYEAEGDAFCGRMLALLPLLQSDFAASPPKFRGVPLELLQSSVKKVYPAMVNFEEFSTVARQLLARLANAKDLILSWPASHVVRQTNPLFSDLSLLEQLSAAAVVLYPWENDGDNEDSGEIQFGSGIPPHVVQLLTSRKLLHEFRHFASGYDGRMTNLINGIFDDRNVANGTISEHRIRSIITTTYDRLFEKLTNQGATTNNLEVATQQRTQGFAPHYHHGKYWRLPANFGFPKGTARDLWRRWNVGDTVNNVPPLRTLDAKEFKFMDGIAGQRPSRKIVADMKMVCEFIESLAKESGVDCCQGLSEMQCFEIFDQVASTENGLQSTSNRRAHIQWRTAIRKIQRLKQQSRDQAAPPATTGPMTETAAETTAAAPTTTAAPPTRQAEAPAASRTPAPAASQQRVRRPAPTVAQNPRRKKRDRRRSTPVEEGTSDAFGNAFSNTGPATRYQQRREAEIIAQFEEEQQEQRRNDEQRQCVETGLLCRDGVNGQHRPVGRCAVPGCNFATLQLLHRCDFCKKHIHTICSEPYSDAVQDKWSCGCGRHTT